MYGSHKDSKADVVDGNPTLSILGTAIILFALLWGFYYMLIQGPSVKIKLQLQWLLYHLNQ